jgi:RNA polymerase sigma-70 factor (ECF subfamily)
MQDLQFLELITQHQGIIHKVCRLYRDSKEDREDLFQEIVFQIWKSLPGFEGRAKITSWMYRIALNTAMSTFRKRKAPVAYVEKVPDYTEEQNDNEDTRQEQMMLALRQLTDPEKAIIALYFDDLSYEEIAEITGMNTSHVGVKLHRIKTKLQKLLKA